jgi:hypothetical protein
MESTDHSTTNKKKKKPFDHSPIPGERKGARSAEGHQYQGLTVFFAKTSSSPFSPASLCGSNGGRADLGILEST